MAVIAKALADISNDSSVLSELPCLENDFQSFISALKPGGSNESERSLARLYGLLHGAGGRYSEDEKKTLDEKDGYSCISGGLSPLVMAEEFIRADSVVADLGAGNGLQGLLLQRIKPHLKTLQIELSAELIRTGRIFQNALGIEDGRIGWINGKVEDAPLGSVDFIYTFRLSKPTERGKKVYRSIAEELKTHNKPLVIFSVADCLVDFLDKRFNVFYNDGHLTCFRKE